MGLLDGLFSGGGGGLLDFLRNNAMNQQMAGGLPSDQAQYSAPIAPMAAPSPIIQANQPSPLDNAQWPQGPIGAPSALPPNAQPTQGQMQPPAQPPQGQGFGDNIMAGLNNLNSGGNPITMLANVASGFATGQRYDRAGIAQQQQNQTARFLESKGMEPGMARAVVSDPNLLRAVLPQIMGTGGQTDDIKEYQFAKREEPSLTFQQFMQRKRAVSGEYSLTPQYGTNEKGETVLIQTGKSGEAIQTKLPAGVKISSGVDKVDLGTQWGIIDKRTGQMVGTQPKDVAGKEAAEKRGQAQGAAQAALANGADLDAEATKKKIDELLSNEGFSSIFGSIDQYRPAWTMDAAGKDARTRFEQLKGTAFLSAYAMLKGGGAITDIEGQKAGAAMARLDRSLSESEAKQALNDFKEAVDMGLKKLRRAASGGDAATPAAPSSSGLPSGWSVKVN